MKYVIILIAIIFSVSIYGDEPKTYNIGTIDQFNTEHLKMQVEDGWTPDQIENGKIGVDWRGFAKPNVCRTTAIIAPIKNPEKDEYVWEKRTENNLDSTTELQFNIWINEWGI